MRRSDPGQSSRGFTLIELLVVITIIGILAAIALPNYIKAKDKAKEVQTKSAVHSIQIAIERYHTDFEEYPLFLIGGDVEGWKNWHKKFDEATTTVGVPANAFVNDPLVSFGFMDSYPKNPFVDNGISVITQTGPINPPAAGYQGGDGDPRFGFAGNTMGNGLENPMIFVDWYLSYGEDQQNIETYRTLTTSCGGNPTAKGFLCPIGVPGYPAGGGSKEGLHYAFGGRWGDPDSTGARQTVFTHWPGNFFYRGFPERLIARKGWTIWFPQAFVKAQTTWYMIGGYGSYATPGYDVVRVNDSDANGQTWYYQLAPPWSNGGQGLFPMKYGFSGGNRQQGGLPECAGGGDDTVGAWLPPTSDPDFPNSFIYGSPDGCKDGIILTLTGGDETQAYEH